MKNGKIFGKINIIDFLVIIAIAVALVGVAIRVATFSDNDVASTVPVECVIRVDGIRDYSVQGLERGGAIYSEKENKLVGEIVNVESEVDAVDLVMLDGERKFVERPNRYVAYVTVKADCVYQNGKYSDAAETQIGVGTEYKICSKYVSTNGIVTSMKPIQ